jgi:NAD(P)-dependent dehydrogenase (short-subunit alcohol dehydrogenase family)
VTLPVDVPSSPSDLFSLAGRTALVTGATQGIGRLISTGLARARVRVYICSRKAEPLSDLADEIVAAGGWCTALPADLGSESECLRVGEELARHEHHLDLLVNNAGNTWVAPLAKSDEKSWERVLALNLKAVFHLTRALLPVLSAAGSADSPARIINIGSISGLHVPDIETYAYSASKAAVHHLTRHLAKTLAPAITVNAIAPGTFPSRMSAPIIASQLDEVVAGTPLRRIGRSDDIVGAVMFLASRAGSFVTGAVLPVDGGIANTL